MFGKSMTLGALRLLVKQVVEIVSGQKPAPRENTGGDHQLKTPEMGPSGDLSTLGLRGVVWDEAALSPGGDLLAYIVPGTPPMVYVARYPSLDGREAVSSPDVGGRDPTWLSRGGTLEVVYWNGGTLHHVPVSYDDNGIRLEEGRSLAVPGFVGVGRIWQYDVHEDQFLILKRTPDELNRVSEVRVQTNWFAELNRIAPPDK